MVPNYITIVSMNCQGLSNQEKRSDTFNFLKSKKNILFTSYKTLILQLKKKNIFVHNGGSNVISVIFLVKREVLQFFSITISL